MPNIFKEKCIEKKNLMKILKDINAFYGHGFKKKTLERR